MFKKMLFCVTATTLLSAASDAQVLSDEKSDLYSLVIAPIDLTDATRAMTIYDPNEDGFVDENEQKRVRWQDEINEYDLNRDGKLTHMEVTVRFAKIRSEAGIEQKHVDNAKVFMRRHDQNKNGQLDPDEIANGWPSDSEEFDKNRDGVITLGEMANRFSYMAGLRREMGIEQVDQVTAIRAVRKFDKDKDQNLDEEEQVGAFLPLLAKDFDEDDNGNLSIMEIATMLAKHRRDSGMSQTDLMKVRSVFERFDSNSDGTIDEREFESAAKLFRSAPSSNPLIPFDKNGDGKLTQIEVQRTMIDQRKSLGFDDAQLAEAKKLLIRHDKNRSTFIEEDELYDSPVSGQLAKSIIELADDDSDKRISLIELAKYLAKQQSKD